MDKMRVVFEDKEIIVVYKPAGLATQTAKIGQPDLVSEIKNYSHASYLGVVHRLDQPVEGLLVFGKTKEAAAALTKQLGQGTLNKQYYAVICGRTEPESAELVDFLYKTKENRAELVPSEQAAEWGAKKAVLQFKILEKQDILLDADDGKATIALADIHIDTGRFHQIRAQMAYAGMPLLGDGKYGDERSRDISRKLGVRNVALCAYTLELCHPVTGKRMVFAAAPSGMIFEKFAIKNLRENC